MVHKAVGHLFKLHLEYFDKYISFKDSAVSDVIIIIIIIYNICIAPYNTIL